MEKIGVLVTGGAGYIGSHAVRTLLEANGLKMNMGPRAAIQKPTPPAPYDPCVADFNLIFESFCGEETVSSALQK